MKNRKKLISDICRIVLGLVFVFSGGMKTIDPWGTAVKLTEYFDVFGMGWLSGLSVGLAVCLCVAELALGLMMLFNVRMRLTSLLTMLFMAFFTVLTFVLAVWNPLDDCGCFGDAVKISNWQTFFKNLVLLPMSIVVWYNYCGQKFFAFTRRDILLTVLFVVLGTTAAVFSWWRLPVVDTFQYKKGTDLRGGVLCTACLQDVRLLYRNAETGEEREFLMTDTVWHDSDTWTYMDTRLASDDLPEKMREHDFAIYRDGENVADEVIYRDGKTIMIMVRNAGKYPGGCERKIAEYIDGLPLDGATEVIYVAGMRDGAELPDEITVGGEPCPVYGMDAELMALLLRADAGIVTVDDGVITDKRSCMSLR